MFQMTLQLRWEVRRGLCLIPHSVEYSPAYSELMMYIICLACRANVRAHTHTQTSEHPGYPHILQTLQSYALDNQLMLKKTNTSHSSDKHTHTHTNSLFLSLQRVSFMRALDVTESWPVSGFMFDHHRASVWFQFLPQHRFPITFRNIVH